MGAGGIFDFLGRRRDVLHQINLASAFKDSRYILISILINFRLDAIMVRFGFVLYVLLICFG